MSDVDVLIVGGGPCGLAASIAAQQGGLRTVVLEAEVVVSTIAHYPTYVRFFSTAEKLGIGGLPFVIATEKPTRRDALAYYRAAVTHFGIPLRQYERVSSIERARDELIVHSRTRGGTERRTNAGAVIVATGYEPDSVCIHSTDGSRQTERLPATLVYVMTGFAPNVDILKQVGIPIDPTSGIPEHDPETLETTVPGVFIAGVVVAGYDANKIFIENGRYHRDRIVARLLGHKAPTTPKLSAELDT